MKDAKQYSEEFLQRNKYSTVEEFVQTIINDAKFDELNILLEVLDSVEDELTYTFLTNKILKLRLELGK